MNECHGSLAVLCIGRCASRSSIVEMIPYAAAGEDSRRDQPRAHIPAVIAQNEFVKPCFARHPIFLGRDEDRLARSPGRPAKDKRVDARAFEYLHERHLPRPFLDDDSRGNAAGENGGEEEDDEKFDTHRNEVETVNRVVFVSNQDRQLFSNRANLENL